MKDLLVVSDLHLGRKDSKVKELLEFLVFNPSKEIIFNGDIFDQFAMWKDKGKLFKNEHLKFAKKIFQLLKGRKVKITYLPGNHDYLLLLLIPFGFLFGVKIRKRISTKNYIAEHGDWIKQYLKIRSWFNKDIKVTGDFHQDCSLFADIKGKDLIVGHSHIPKFVNNLYDEGDWVDNMTALGMKNNKKELLFYKKA